MFYDTSRFDPQQIKSLNDAYRWINTEYGNTVHMTIIFNAFVLYALFNQINSRILDDSFNIFRRIHTNMLFIVILVAEFVIQYFLVQHGGLLFKCTVGGLTTSQWLVCIGLGSSTWLISILLKMTKLETLFEIKFSNMFKSENSSEDLKQNLFEDRRGDVDNTIARLELENM
jgi:Ca2+-transporting ATPase